MKVFAILMLMLLTTPNICQADGVNYTQHLRVWAYNTFGAKPVTIHVNQVVQSKNIQGKYIDKLTMLVHIKYDEVSLLYMIFMDHKLGVQRSTFLGSDLFSLEPPHNNPSYNDSIPEGDV